MTTAPRVPSLKTLSRAAEGAARIQRLLVLDSVWTQYLAEVTAIPSREIRLITKIGSEMIRLLDCATGDSASIGELAKGRAVWSAVLERAESGFLTTEPGGKQDKAGAFAALLRRHLRGINNKTVERERAALSKKLKILRHGNFTRGDIGTRFGCHLCGTLLLFFLLTENPAAAAGMYVRMRSMGCFD